MTLVYVHNFDGTKAPFASVEDAMAQASHDAKYGFQIPVKITEGEDGKVLHNTSAIRKAADKL